MAAAVAKPQSKRIRVDREVNPWQIERQRLARQGWQVFGWHNRLLRGYLSMVGELAGDQWNEGDVSCSVVRRVALPDAFYALDGLFETFLTVLAEFGAFPAVIEAELARRQLTESVNQIGSRFTEAMQVKTALQSGIDAKRQTLGEFEQELQATGLAVTPDMEEKARHHKREVEEQLVRTRSRRTQAEAQFQVCRRDIDSLQGRLAHEGKDYKFYIPEKVLDCFNDEFDYRFIANCQELTDMAVAIFVGLIDTPNVTTGGGGGGSQSDLPWRDKDEDDLQWARRCAHAASRLLGKKPKSGLKR